MSIIVPITVAQPAHSVLPTERPRHDVQGASTISASPASSSDARIRILLADDHPVMRQGLRTLLSGLPDVVVVGEATDGLDALEKARNLRPDLILMDFSMPKLNGLEATRQIRQEMPEIQVIGLSMYQEPDRAIAMKSAGAAAYLSKSDPSEVLIRKIRSFHRAPVELASPSLAQTS